MSDGSREPLLAVRGLKKHFPIMGGLLRRQIGTVYAVDGVDFRLERGETFDPGPQEPVSPSICQVSVKSFGACSA